MNREIEQIAKDVNDIKLLLTTVCLALQIKTYDFKQDCSFYYESDGLNDLFNFVKQLKQI